MTEKIKIEPHFFNKGYMGVSWEDHDAVITNADGDVIFEKKACRFPKSWSHNARNIVASKYFYGEEDSLMKLVTRVTDKISDYGLINGYFHSDNDAYRFNDELKWLLISQYGSFNSPVWFNVGLDEYVKTDETPQFGWSNELQKVVPVDPYTRPQASACFIISVEDSIEDIWDLVSESARLFKYGSGVGADWSKLRSTKETLSGGGKPSGPVSFMEVQDTTAKTIKSGGKTRRAAIMQTLNARHADVMEFVLAKQTEERKAWALIEQGYDGSFNGDAYGSVAFQNVNQSVRIDNDVMQSVSGGIVQQFGTIGQSVGELSGEELLRAIAEGTHLCGDPGIQYTGEIDLMHTCPNDGRINSSNPCSEYMFLDDTACNLASLNLKKFLKPDMSFNVDEFRKAARIFIIAQEILVDLAGYPSEIIALNSHKYRTLGLGFANLGAMLMAKGLPYDSDEGRAIAGAITAIMHGEAYRTSAELASVKGPFDGFENNKYEMMTVIERHLESAQNLPESDLKDEAIYAMGDAYELGHELGYRNAQVTVLAPTGTISFMMDCDTTGIEPDIALVKYKLLAGEGEGVMKIVNRSVEEGLLSLDYDEDQITVILEHIEENDTIEGCSLVDPAHLPVFDCAFKPANGERSIRWEAHIKMMGALQPFISGAISKTVNMPEESTVEDIMNAYMMAWKEKLKAVAIYRDNSKRSQPLNTSKKSLGDVAQEAMASLQEEQLDRDTLQQILIETPQASPKIGGFTTDDLQRRVDTEEEKSAAQSLAEFFSDDFPFNRHALNFSSKQRKYLETLMGAQPPRRRKLLDSRKAIAHKFSISGHEGYIHAGLYTDGTLGEVFIRMSKQGSTLSGIMDALATSISIGLQYGVPLEDLIRKFRHTSFEPSGFTPNPDIRNAKSIVDYLAQWLEQQFLLGASNQYEWTAEIEGTASITVGESDGPSDVTTKQDVPYTLTESSGPPCPVCGTITIRSGSCATCPNCGTTTGCG